MNYKLLSNSEGIYGAILLNSDGSQTSFLLHEECNYYGEYLRWLEEGNTPLPPDPIPEPEPLTAQQKLEAAGLTIEELKDLLGL